MRMPIYVLLLLLLEGAAFAGKPLNKSRLSLSLAPSSSSTLLDLSASACGTALQDKKGIPLTTGRGSSGTYWCNGVLNTAAIGQPRVEVDPDTGRTALLTEPYRNNYFYPTVMGCDAFTTGWAVQGGGSCAATAGLDAFGLNRAVSFTFVGTTNEFGFHRVTGLAQNTQYTHSIYARTQSGTTTVRMSRTNGVVWAGAAVSPALTLTTTPKLISLTYTTGAGETQSDFLIGGTNSISSNAGTIILSDPQLEAGAYPTSRIPTTTGVTQRREEANRISFDAARFTKEEGCISFTFWVKGFDGSSTERVVGPGFAFDSTGQVGSWDGFQNVFSTGNTLTSPTRVRIAWSKALNTRIVSTLTSTGTGPYNGDVVGTAPLWLGAVTGGNFHAMGGWIQELKIGTRFGGCPL